MAWLKSVADFAGGLLGGGSGGGRRSEGTSISFHISNQSAGGSATVTTTQTATVEGQAGAHGTGTGGAAHAGATAAAQQAQTQQQRQSTSQPTAPRVNTIARDRADRGSADHSSSSSSDPESKAATETQASLIEILGNAVKRLIETVNGLEASQFPIGTIVAWHKSAFSGRALPRGWVECNGPFERDGRHFNIPDLNGKHLFIRGGTESGVEQTSEFKSHNHGGLTGASAPAVKDTQGHAMYRVQMHGNVPPHIDVWRVSFHPDGPHGPHAPIVAESHAHTITFAGGDETRPANVSMVWIIRIE